MRVVLVVVGLALAFSGYAVERQGPVGFNRATAVGVTLFVIGEIFLFGEGWLWGLIGFVIPPLLIEPLLFVARRR